ncbi:MAG: hypothetical protein LBV62_01910 [Rickettsiales bacterium]|jgi:hypothetical protein|nr:hypothetical protein [Rickettsiales bacterium]
MPELENQGSTIETPSIPVSTNTTPQDDQDLNPPSPGETGSTISNVLGATAPPKPPRVEVKETGGNGETTPKILPQKAPRSTALQTNDENEILESTNLFGEPSSDEEEQETPNVANPGHIYTAIGPKTKSPKKSSDSVVGNQSSEMQRSPSQKTVFSDPKELDLAEKLEEIKGLGMPTTPPPSYKSKDDSEKSSFLESRFDTNSNATLKSKETNRTWPKVKYAMQQKGFIIFSASAIIFGISTVSVYLQDKEKFIALVTNSPNYITIPVIALASLLAISPIFYAIKQFRNTEEYQIQGKNADGILDEVLKHQPEDKAIKSVRLEYSNNTHSNFIFNAWESKNDFINIDEKVISRTNKIKSVINNRPLFTALLTGVVAANIALPLGLLAIHGVNGVQKFYQNPLTNNIELLLLIGSVALLVVCLSVHYYNKTNCTNLIYSQEKIDPKKVNEKLIGEVKQERTKVLEENHSKDAKCSNLTLEQVVVQSHNYPDAAYSVG